MTLRWVKAGLAAGQAVLLGASVALGQAGPEADPFVAARTLGYEGVAAYQASDFATASQKLHRAYELLPAPSLGLWSARSLVKLNLLVQAARRYQEVSRSTLLAGDAAVQQDAKREAARELAELLPRIPSVSLELRGAAWHEVAVTIDGVPIARAEVARPIAINPGERLIEAQSGTQKVVVRITALPQQQATALLEFSGAPAAPGPGSGAESLELGLGAAQAAPPGHDSGSNATWRTLGWIGIGVGGSALVLSGVAGLVAWTALDDFDCKRDPCTSGDADAVDTYNSLVTASTVGYVAGGLVAGAGALLLYRYRASDSDLTLGVGAGSVTLGGRF